MPMARWGVKANEIDDFDRSSQRIPYRGPTPPNGVYLWRVKICKYAAGTREKNPQIRLGLELVPREDYPGEEQYVDKNGQGYWIMAFLPVNAKTYWRYVPFLDAIGVTGSEFERRTKVDEDQNIVRIGSWRNDGETLIEAQLKDGEDEKGNPRKEIGQIMTAEEYEEEEFDEEEYADEE